MEVGIEYSMRGRRLSGDMNTACGNAILMVLMVGTVMSGAPFEFRIYDDGDDCLLFVPREDAVFVGGLMVRRFLEFGVTLKVEHQAQVIEEVQFCQARPVYWANGKGVLVPEPRKQLSQMYAGVKYGRSPRLDNRLLYTTSECLLHLYSSIPVLGAFHAMVHRATRPVQRRSYQDDAFAFWVNLNAHAEVSPSLDDYVRLSFERAYGISPTEQRLMEAAFDSVDVYFGAYKRVPVSFDATNWCRVDTCRSDTVPFG